MSRLELKNSTVARFLLAPRSGDEADMALSAALPGRRTRPGECGGSCLPRSKPGGLCISS